jgi:hypothetical protein
MVFYGFMFYRLCCWVPLLLLMSASPLSAQSVWTGPPEHADEVSVEWLKPVLDDGGDTSFWTSSMILSGQATLSDRLLVVGELPMSHVQTQVVDDVGEEQTLSSTTVGNPYLGIELRGTTMPFVLELGAHLPVVEDPEFTTVAIGALTDLNRIGAYVVNQVPLQLIGNYYYDPRSSNFSIRLRGGPETYLPAGGNASGSMILTYGAQGWYRTDILDAGLGFTGRWGVTQPNAGFRESSLHQVSTVLQKTFGRVRPGVLARIPLETEFRDAMSAVVGVTMTVSLSDTSGK